METFKASRVVTPDDHEKVYLMHRVLFPRDDAVFVHQGWWWLLRSKEDKKVPAAFCGMTPSRQYPDEIIYFIRSGVMKAHQGKGLQRKMIAIRERKAKAMGFWGIVTTTYDNPASANNLIKCGYTQFTPIAPWGVPGTSYWLKTLIPGDARVRRIL